MKGWVHPHCILQPVFFLWPFTAGLHGMSQDIRCYYLIHLTLGCTAVLGVVMFWFTVKEVIWKQTGKLSTSIVPFTYAVNSRILCCFKSRVSSRRIDAFANSYPCCFCCFLSGLRRQVIELLFFLFGLNRSK